MFRLYSGIRRKRRGTVNKILVGAILKEYGFVTEEQIEEAISWQRLHKGSRFEEVLIAMGFITEQQLLSALRANSLYHCKEK